MPHHLCWQILPINLQDFIIEWQKTLNLADVILILVDLISLAYFMQHVYVDVDLSTRSSRYSVRIAIYSTER